MDSATTQFVIGDRDAKEMLAYLQIAKVNRSMLTLGEVLEATSISASEEDVENAWEANAVLSSKYTLDGGWIVEKSADPQRRSEWEDTERGNRQRSAANIEAARSFATTCVDGRVKLMAVSGGNSYRRALPHDDIDFFSITKNDSVWVFMLKALITARLHGIGRKKQPSFCFSYIVEERKAWRDFARPSDGLFARDALMAHVLTGASYYQSLISESRWMEMYFPKLYRRRVVDATPQERLASSRRGHRLLNSLLFYTLGTYVRMKAFTLNRRLQKAGNTAASFHAELGKDRCIYESNRYKRLRKMYPRPEERMGR